MAVVRPQTKERERENKSRESLKSLLAKKKEEMFRQNMYAVCEEVERGG